jgi:hypothetical protein
MPAAPLVVAQRAVLLQVPQGPRLAAGDRVAVEAEIRHSTIDEVGRVGPLAGERSQLAGAERQVVRDARHLAVAAAFQAGKVVALLIPCLPPARASGW